MHFNFIWTQYNCNFVFPIKNSICHRNAFLIESSNPDHTAIYNLHLVVHLAAYTKRKNYIQKSAFPSQYWPHWQIHLNVFECHRHWNLSPYIFMYFFIIRLSRKIPLFISDSLKLSIMCLEPAPSFKFSVTECLVFLLSHKCPNCF